MALSTCIIANNFGSVVIGWSNVAVYPAFRDWLDARIATGHTYEINDVRTSFRTVVYNEMLFIDHGITVPELLAVRGAGLDEFLKRGDISIVRFEVSRRIVTRLAENADDILRHDVIEYAPPLLKH